MKYFYIINEMKLYTYYTKSHKHLFDNYLKPTLNEFEIIAIEGEQDCPSGSYYSTGWKNTTMKKIDVFLKALNESDIFVFSDVDIQFFGNIKEQLLNELGDNDIAIQNDYGGGMCSGFFICRSNARTKMMFNAMKNKSHLYLEDQDALNKNIQYCKHTILSNKFWTFGNYGKQWKGENFDIPDDILMHHANWVEGIQNKVKLLDIVKYKFNLKSTVKSSLNNYQIFLNDFFKEFRPIPIYPTYPPYHKGKYLEGYFFDIFKGLDTIYYIPVDWTTSYIQNLDLNLLQEKLLALDKSKKYFTVSQHDDAIKEWLPDCIKFCAGGNKGGIPIPLVCSPIEIIEFLDKDIFCSFVGSNTHPIRQKMYDILKDNSKYYIKIKQWSDTISDVEKDNYLNIMNRSIFTLCPRGYGKNSFRMYEAMQFGSIPVYICNDFNDDWRAFKDEIKWDDFSITIYSNELNNIEKRLNLSDEKIKQMSNKCIEVYKTNFSIKKVCLNIIERCKNI